MADYQRFVSYIYSYPGGVKDKNVGFAKVEVVRGEIRLNINLRGVYTDTPERWIYILAVFIGPYMTVSAVWTIADIFNGLMALPNMIALFALSGVVVKETKSFFERHNNEKL